MQMTTVRNIAAFLYFPARILAWMVILITAYLVVVLLVHRLAPAASLPINIVDSRFEIMFPFTKSVFLLGDYSSSYIISYSISMLFYAAFLWLLSNVFHVFRQQRLFTRNGVYQLSRFYITNLLFPVILIGLLLATQQQVSDVFQVLFLHVVIGVFAYFMTAIFKQAVLLQEEQDLTF